MIDDIKKFIKYDPETGKFTWIKSRKGPAHMGDEAGSNRGQGYMRIVFNSKKYYAHRLAWWFVHGQMPEVHLDHIDGDPSNNKISNLRMCTDGQNAQNRCRARSDSGTKLIGAFRKKNKFSSSIKVDGSAIQLGTFDTAEEAHKAYVAAKKLHHPFSARL